MELDYWIPEKTIAYQLYLPKLGSSTGEGEWTSVANVMRMPDGRMLPSKRLANGDLQYVRRTGAVGVAPLADLYRGGEPKFMQWRVHPAEPLVRTVKALYASGAYTEGDSLAADFPGGSRGGSILED